MKKHRRSVPLGRGKHNKRYYMKSMKKCRVTENKISIINKLRNRRRSSAGMFYTSSFDVTARGNAGQHGVWGFIFYYL